MSAFTVQYDGEAAHGRIAFNDPKDGIGPVPPLVQDIQFQHGPIGENGINGIQNEEVLELLTLRLRDLNAKFPCRENSIAITHIEEAEMWLRKRTAARRAQGVEGKNEAHVS